MGFLMRLSNDVKSMDYWWKGDADALLRSPPTAAVMIANNHNSIIDHPSHKLSIILFIEIAPPYLHLHLHRISRRKFTDTQRYQKYYHYHHAAALRLLDIAPCLTVAASSPSCHRRRSR